MARKNHETLSFSTLLLEGALFVPDLLEKIARGEHTRQQGADYLLPKGLKLHDEYGRAFQIALAQWRSFAPGLVRQDSDPHAATMAFARELLRDALGYADLAATGGITLANGVYPIPLMASGRVPVIVAPHDLPLDDPDPRFVVEGGGSRKKSAFQLAQEFLNASHACLWALVINGRQLRLLRDAATLTRPSFLEFDLENILGEGGRYPDFAALWRILHASRAGREDTSATDCIWEQWRNEGRTQGTRVREGLRIGVTQALIDLGEGFLQHPDNDSLRLALHEGALTRDGYFQELLRLIYRFLFLFTLEERELLHLNTAIPDGQAAREVYAQGYALRRLTGRALRRVARDRYDDLWQGQRIVFRGLRTGEPRLALPALGGLFAASQCPTLDDCALGNRAFLAAMYHLRWAMVGGSLSLVDYGNMGPEELGSVYESLLELTPSIDLAARTFGFVGITEEGDTSGHARKTTGSYYTPDSLVQELIKSALDPVIEAHLAARPDNPTAALLAISVIDPACGSGHFLLAAARRLAERLAQARAVDGAARLEDYRHALREVIAHSIFGVDKNPLALELARTALWLEGYEPGRPLSFLDHHLIQGDALLGLTDFAQLRDGIPDVAFKPLSGDDKEACKKLSQANRQGRKLFGKQRNWAWEQKMGAEQNDALARLHALEAMPDTTPQEVAAKEEAYAAFLLAERQSSLAHGADIFVGAFLLPKQVEAAVPTSVSLAAALAGGAADASHTACLAAARAACTEAGVLHWPLAFPQVFSRGGFDCVLANPPWERIKLQEEEFFATRHPEIANAKNKAERGQRIAWLAQGMLAKNLHPELPHDDRVCEAEQSLYQAFITARRSAEAASLYAHVKGEEGGRYPLTGVGDVNTYALFAETISQIVVKIGRAGFIVPTGIATDDSTKAYFFNIVMRGKLVALYSFENEEFIFPAVHHSFRFCLLILGEEDNNRPSEFIFFARQPIQLLDTRRRFSLTPEEFKLLNPNTRTCPVFRSRMDAELTRKIYSRVPVLIREADEDAPGANPWGIRFMRMLDMANDSHLFADTGKSDHLPLYEAKMIHQFDHRWASYQQDEDGEKAAVDVALVDKDNPGFSVTPRYRVRTREVLARIADVPKALARGYTGEDEKAVLYTLANWVEAGHGELKVLKTAAQARENLLALAGPLFAALPLDAKAWRDEKIQAEARDHQPLQGPELAALRRARDLWAAVDELLDGRSPRWLMGWRDITSAHVLRTVIASVLPRVGVGHTLPLWSCDNVSPHQQAALLGNFNSLVLDGMARQKVGGTHLTYSYLKQFPVLPPEAYSEADLAFIVPRVLELTYTSHDLAPWARDLGHTGPPFAFDPERRALLRAELDGYYARLYGLNRDELRYILDPAEVMGSDYPSETFRVLKTNELREHGEFRTQRLVLAAWDRLEGMR
ncbi:MAG: SAM-dependent DNA methyltransferase [Desulforudis sp.]|jgi:hypothetical protein|nr:MAG: SAM-dependent DNA methyltransferase [Desulforudis sp.]